MRSLRAVALDFGVLVVAVLIVQAVLWLTANQTALDQISPALLHSIRFAADGAEHVLDGTVPLWNPHAFGGFPFHASGVAGVFYPANLLFAWDDQLLALRTDFVIHALIAGFGAYVLARQLYGRRVPALLVGVATVYTLPAVKLFAGEPIYTLHAFAYVPWLIVCCRQAATSGGLIWGLLAALIVAVQILTGAFQLTALSMAAAGGYVVFEALRRYFALWEPLGRVLRMTAVALAGIVFGVALAGVQVVPSFELFANSSDSQVAKVAGEAESVNYLHRVVVPSPDGTMAPNVEPTIEIGGLFLLILAAFGLVRSPVRERWTVGVVALGGYMFVSGSLTNLHVYPQIFSLPFFSSATAFGEAGIVASLFFILLAGAGAAAAIERSDTGLLQARFVWPLCVALAAAAAWSVWVADGLALSSKWTIVALAALGLAALMVRKQRAFVVGAWLIGCLLFDLSNTVEAAVPTPALRTGSDLYGGNNEFRQIALEFKGAGRLAMLPVQFDPADTHLFEGMLSDERTLPLFSSKRATFMGDPWSAPLEAVSSMWRFPDSEFDGTVADREGVRAAIQFLRALNVEYLVSPKPGPAVINRLSELSDDVFQRHELPNSVIYKVVDASPAAYILHNVEVRDPGETFAERVADVEFDWRRTALVEEPMTIGQGGAPSENEGIRLTEYDAESVEIELFVDSPGILVLTDGYYPGWRATFADGTERDVIRVNQFLRGVLVQPGDSGVTFSYQPESLAAGRRLSLGAAAIWAMLVLIAAVAGAISWRKSRRT